MESIRIQSHAGPDGVLKIEVPVEMGNTDYEVVVIVQPVQVVATPAHNSTGTSPEELGWPPGFFEQTAGSLENNPIERPAQPPYETRKDIFTG